MCCSVRQTWWVRVRLLDTAESVSSRVSCCVALQYAAVCCSALQCTALPCVAVCYSVLQCVADLVFEQWIVGHRRVGIVIHNHGVALILPPP